MIRELKINFFRSILSIILITTGACSSGGGGGEDSTRDGGSAVSSASKGIRILNTSLESAPVATTVEGKLLYKSMFMGDAPRTSASGLTVVQLVNSQNDTIFSSSIDAVTDSKTILVASRNLEEREVPEVFVLNSVERSSESLEIVHGVNGAGSISYTIQDLNGSNISSGTIPFGSNVVVPAPQSLIVSIVRTADRLPLGSVQVGVDTRTVVVGGDVAYYTDIRAYK